VSESWITALAHVLLTATVSRTALFTLLAAGLIVRASFLNMTPIGSDDIYRYLWDGKVQAAGVNPYADRVLPRDVLARFGPREADRKPVVHAEDDRGHEKNHEQHREVLSGDIYGLLA
jgi:hypothetical protein